MARFPIDDSKLADLGKAIANAVNDPNARASLKNDPKSYLLQAGVPQSSLAGINLKIVEDTPTELHIIIPAALDNNKINAGDQNYLEEIGHFIALACTH